MGQKVNPKGFRVGIKYKGQTIRDWDSKWYAEKTEFVDTLHQDIQIRKFLNDELKTASIDTVRIEREKGKVTVFVHSSRPNQIFGDDDKKIKELTKKVAKISNSNVRIEVVKIQNVFLNARLVAEQIAQQIENRSPFRRAQKFAIQKVMKAGAKGIKTKVKGRLNGVDMARHEGYSEGRIPLSTLRADIDYALAEADTKYGKIGVKVWIYKGEVMPDLKEKKFISKSKEEVR